MLKRYLCSFLIIVFVLFAGGCEAVSKQDVGSEEDKTATNTFTGLVTYHDTLSGKMSVRELNSNATSNLNFDATAAVEDRFGQTVSADKIETGQILEVTYDTFSAKLISAEVPKNVWEYKDVDSFSFNESENMIRLAEKKFRYSPNTLVASGNNYMNISDINLEDIITVRGVGIDVCSVVRNAGHGFIRMRNYEDFIGGMADIGNGMILPITENMLVTVGEGEHRIVLMKDSMITAKDVSVPADTEVIADFSDYVPAVKDVGYITFKIEPHGADLYINSHPVSYGKPVALNYGEYNIRVQMNGYNTYSGVLDVEDPKKTVNIDLTSETASVEGGSASSSPESTAASQTSDADEGSVDSEHYITVTAPVGVEVYLNNVYKGLSPCKFKKVIGKSTITLSMVGYETKSYSIDVSDDGEDVILKFDDLKDEETSPTPETTVAASDG